MSENASPAVAKDYAKFVPLTARMMAALRARETQRSDRLFEDPYAEMLAGPEAFVMADERFSLTDQDYVAIRTKFFDDFLSASNIRQIVLLASGLDSRAYRLPWLNSTHLFELDLPEVLQYKAQVLQGHHASCQHHLISADLTELWLENLLAAGFDPLQPSLFLVEGLLMYLSSTHVHQLLENLSSIESSGSQLGLDVINTEALNYEPLKGYFRFGVDSPESLLSEYGWEASVLQPGEDGANYERIAKAPSLREIEGQQRTFFVTAHKTLKTQSPM